MMYAAGGKKEGNYWTKKKRGRENRNIGRSQLVREPHRAHEGRGTIGKVPHSNHHNNLDERGGEDGCGNSVGRGGGVTPRNPEEKGSRRKRKMARL